MAKTGLKLTNCDERTLASLAGAGDQGAFLVLYDRFKAGVLLHVSNFIPIREEAEDVMLESFQKAFAQISTYNPEFKFSTWLYKIARNTAFDHLQKIGKDFAQVQVNSIDDVNSPLVNIATSVGNPELEVIRSQEYEKLVAAIEGLPDLYRDVARLILLDNYGYQEVSEKLGIPLNTIKTRLKRAKENVIKKMDKSEEDMP